MKVSMQKISDIKHTVEMFISCNLIEKEVSKALDKMRKTACIDGFRKGKIPKTILKNRYEPYIRKKVLNDLINKKFLKFINEHDIQPIGKLNCVIKNFQEKNGCICRINFEIYPKINIKNISHITINKPLVSVNPEDVNFTINKLRSEHASWITSTLKIEKYDRVTINIKPIQKYKIFQEEIRLLTFIIGNNTISTELEKKIIGKKSKTYFIFSLNYKIINLEKNSYHNMILDFLINIIKVEKKILPKLDSKFFEKINLINFKSPEKMKNELCKSINMQLKYFVHIYIKYQLINQILNDNYIKIPVQLVHEEIKIFLESTYKNNLNKFSKLDFSPFLNKKLIDRLTYQIQSRIIFQKILHLNKIQINQNDLTNIMHNLLKINKIPEKNWKKYKKNKKFIQKSIDIASENAILEIIMQQANFVEEKITFKLLVKKIERS
ncbi:cell division trigger factor [Wigglesworthia glossinidia endosymbiont of Glossina morsitans morsitans (Yale colony)]|uniref:Trigger factor n=1 Tax=Wigglesworthia glossinidia endosymbiont of Glossina morsitans morsitans (Yale colony) TaxID=1142511 RepID=H6Q5F7_WIGGL|nr:trigger factor [Wigglesworthia glossinidia]AFA41440.1 cell division trigger factor [Wigglesworthia glossinidia endosymbiont of Glossina morsitans morsitans (Yale colony)]